MQARALTADDFITEIQFLQSRATHYWRKAVDKLEKLERFASHLCVLSVQSDDVKLGMCLSVIALCGSGAVSKWVSVYVSKYVSDKFMKRCTCI